MPWKQTNLELRRLSERTTTTSGLSDVLENVHPGEVAYSRFSGTSQDHRLLSTLASMSVLKATEIVPGYNADELPHCACKLTESHWPVIRPHISHRTWSSRPPNVSKYKSWMKARNYTRCES